MSDLRYFLCGFRKISRLVKSMYIKILSRMGLFFFSMDLRFESFYMVEEFGQINYLMKDERTTIPTEVAGIPLKLNGFKF